MEKSYLSENTEATEEVSDRLGIIVSAICCIHCMATPLLMILSPGLVQYFENEYIHMAMITLVVPLGLYSFISKFSVHENKTPLYIGIIGMILLILAIAFHELHGHGHAEYIEMSLSVLGGIALIWAHVMNVKLCRCHTCAH